MNLSITKIENIHLSLIPEQITIMKYKRIFTKLLLACFCLLAPAMVFGQEIVTGIVVDAADKMPLPGATVSVQGTTKVTKTGDNGKFSIEASNGQTLAISFTGYVLKNLTVTGKNVGTIQLSPTSNELTDVVVVGYGTQKKINLTGSVQVVKGDELVNRPTPTLSQALQGKVTGVNFGAGTYGFEPGAALNLQIRGQGSPLILVDGVMTTSLNGINPNDVESISLLKDAAASAIYGARAPYGVLLVTTKNGGKDGKLNINYSGSYVAIKPLNMPHMLDSYTTALAFNEASDNTGIAHVYSDLVVNRIRAYQADPVNTPETYPNPSSPTLWGNTFLSNANYDWFDIFYGNGYRQQHNLSLNGGTEKVSFYFSGGYVYDGGLLQIGSDNYSRYNFTSKVDAKLAKWIKLSSNTRYYNTSRTTPAYDNQGGYDLLFHQVARTYPSQYYFSPNGIASIQSKVPWTRDAGTENTRVNDFVQRFAAEITPAKGWTVNADYSFDLTQSAFTSNNFTVYEDDVAGNPVVSGSTSNAYVSKTQDFTIYRTFNVYSKYNFDFGQAKHHLSLMAGFQKENSNYEYIYARKTGLITSSVPSISTSTGIENAGDQLRVYGTEGVFSRLNYDYDDRYLLEVNGRYDGTYKFTDGKKFGFFPSASIGWNIFKENFFKSLSSTINTMKIRASYGALGNQLGAEAYQDTPFLGVSSNANWIVNGVRPSYVTGPNLINPDVTWETSRVADIGLDFSMFHDRLTFTGDIYQRLTIDQLGSDAGSVPATIGVTAFPQVNNRETKTNGWEVAIGWRDKIGKDFKYSINAQLFDYLTTVTKFNNPTNILTTSYTGQKVGEIWGYVTTGLIQDQATADAINTNKTQAAISGQTWRTGDVQYTDLNGDGKVDFGNNTLDNPGDKRIIGNSTPRYQFGLTLRAEWKGFDISMFWQGVGKRDLPIGFGGTTNMFWGFTTNAQSSFFKDHMDYYRDVDATEYAGLGKNLDAYFPRPYFNANMNAKNQVLQTRYLQNGAYARLKNLQLGYNLPQSLLSKIKLSGIYLYVSGENLITISSLPNHFDPETAVVGSRGDGKSFFPSTAYTFGINVKF
ncbi:SusC/RagA family TonB-linked outer membrane protein [Pedobacter sp. MW01-1-1]|uniref:SusC/RagA family TonB-linked outer membrane protein n=1 Tax=Pedobacter sp. MW01-1-1 TaxID=3383027 RepID=UPI003FED7D78